MTFSAKRPSSDRPSATLAELVRNEGKTVRITIDLDEKLYKRLKHKAIDRRESLADILRAQISRFVDE